MTIGFVLEHLNPCSERLSNMVWLHYIMCARVNENCVLYLTALPLREHLPQCPIKQPSRNHPFANKDWQSLSFLQLWGDKSIITHDRVDPCCLSRQVSPSGLICFGPHDSPVGAMGTCNLDADLLVFHRSTVIFRVKNWGMYCFCRFSGCWDGFDLRKSFHGLKIPLTLENLPQRVHLI